MSQPSHREFCTFVSAHGDWIFNLALRMLNNREDAEEAAQDVLLRVHRNFASFRGGSTVRTWVHKITENVCRTRLSRRKEGHVHPDAELPGTPFAWDAFVIREFGPEELLIGKDLRELVNHGLDAISPDDRKILRLYFHEELSYEEIAARLGVPFGTASTWIYRALKRLNGVLRPIRKELRG